MKSNEEVFIENKEECQEVKGTYKLYDAGSLVFKFSCL